MDQSFLSTSGYWVHQHYLAEPIQQVDAYTVSQTRYSFIATSRTEHGDKDQSMTVRTVRVYKHKQSGHRWTEHFPYFNVNKTLTKGRELYRKLLAQGYKSDA